jgi:hypothetical protein
VSVWRQHRPTLDDALGFAGRTMLYWHVVPIAISFLVPKRLATFVWYVGPTHFGFQQPYDFLGGVALYWRALALGFQVAPWSAWLAVILALVGATQIRRLAPGSRVVFLLALIGFAAVVLHPQHQGRFLASWIFSFWVAAGIGTSVALACLTAALRPVWRIAVSTVAVAALAMLQIAQTPSSYAEAVAIRGTAPASDLDLVRPFLPDVDGLRAFGMLSTIGDSSLMQWTAQERCRCRIMLDRPLFSPSAPRESIAATTRAFVERTAVDLIVVLDAPGYPEAFAQQVWPYDHMRGINDAMSQQRVFAPGPSHDVPQLGARVTVWRRVTPQPPPAG